MIGRRAALALLAALDQDKPLGRRAAARAGFLSKWGFRATVTLYPAFALASWVRLAYRKALRLGPRTVYGPTPIISISDQVKVLRSAGLEAESLVFTTYFITSDFDHNLFPLVSNPATAGWFPNALFLWSLLRYDVYNFFYDGGLWSGMKIVPNAKWIELPLLRLAGKRVVMTAYGADVRVRSINERWSPNICSECPAPGKHCICTDDTLMNARYAGDWANAVIAMGDMSDFVPGARLTPNHWPIDTDAVPFIGVAEHEGPIVIAHSPNHREFKGTRFLLEAVDELVRRGHDVQVDMIERVSNTEARQRYAKADIIFCQCLAGWMGFTEIEGMAFGKPVVTYLRNDDYLADSPGFAGVSAPPEHLVDELERLVVDFDARRRHGLASREWVEKYWSYRAVAPSMKELHLDAWNHNGLLRTLRAKRLDLKSGRGRWFSTVPPKWSSQQLAPPVTVDMHRLGGVMAGLQSSPAVQAACAAMLRGAGSSADSAEAQLRTLAALVLDTDVMCGPTLAFTLFHANRCLSPTDELAIRVRARVAQVAEAAMVSSRERTILHFLDVASLAVALVDAEMGCRSDDWNGQVDRLRVHLRQIDVVALSALDPRQEFEQRFLLAAMLQAWSRATADGALETSAERLRQATEHLARRTMFSLEGTW